MAQILLISPMGGVQVKANETYTSADAPAGTDVVTLCRGVRITDETDNLTPLRGVRVLIAKDGATYPKTNVPIIWKEGETMVFTTGTNYTFLDSGIVSIGIKVTA